MSSLFSRLPIWLLPILGVGLLALSAWTYFSEADSRAREIALAGEPPLAVDLETFTAADLGPAGEISVFGQTSDDYRFRIEPTGFSGEPKSMVPLFPAIADTDERSVTAVLLADDGAALDDWLAANEAGNARIGALYTINGLVVDGQGYATAIRLTLRDAGLEQGDDLVIIAPFLNGRAAALQPPSGIRFGNPYLLFGLGLLMLALWLILWKRAVKLDKGLDHRFSEIRTAPAPVIKDPLLPEELPENVSVLDPTPKATPVEKKAAKPRSKAITPKKSSTGE